MFAISFNETLIWKYCLKSRKHFFFSGEKVDCIVAYNILPGKSTIVILRRHEN